MIRISEIICWSIFKTNVDLAVPNSGIPYVVNTITCKWRHIH